MKVSDHWVRSPLLNISRACQTCHPYAESEIQGRVDAIQDRTHALLNRSATALMDLLDAAASAKKAGATDDEIAESIFVAMALQAGGAFAHGAIAMNVLSENAETAEKK